MVGLPDRWDQAISPGGCSWPLAWRPISPHSLRQYVLPGFGTQADTPRLFHGNLLGGRQPRRKLREQRISRDRILFPGLAVVVPPTLRDLQCGDCGADNSLSPCLKTYDVEWVTSFVARDGSQCVCVYEARDAESVRSAYRAAKVPFQFKVWPATRYSR